MPIPQLKSSFHSRKIGDSNPQFKTRKVSQKKPKKRRKKFSYTRKSNRNTSKSIWKRMLRKMFPYILAFIFLFGIFVIASFAWYSKDLPDPYKIMDRSVALSTKIYDRTGETLLYEVHGPEKRTLVDIDELPDYIKNATIAIEDKDFYNHGGISLRGIIRGQIIPRLSGKRSQGGSTLTQQFVKNAILTNERKISRKIKEWILSYRLEKKFSKDEILQLYFNEIPYGGSAYGVESAAKYYFDKEAIDLTLAEAAILAALPKAPSYYSPFGNNKDLLIDRQYTVLHLMEEQGYITEQEMEIAKQQELVFKKRAENILAPHFVMYVKELLENKYGANIIEQSGWVIKTSLDWEIQQKAEEVIDEIAPSNLERFNASNAALVSLDVETSEILAMVGSKDYFNDEIDGQVNVALSERQPGSSLKPLAYLSAFIKGFRPDTIILDLVTNFASSGDDYEPQNYDLKERGPVTMRKALAGSLNISAVKTLYLAGVYNVLDLANKFGYTTLDERDRYGLSLVLGGGEVKLLEHVNAYAAFAREGVYKDSIAILEIKDSEGEVIEENDNNKGRRIVDKEYVRILNGVLSDNQSRAYVFGESNNLILPDREVAAKTGTTNDYRDAWTIGFTPNIATGVWAGNNNNDAMNEGASGSSVAAPIWNKFMRNITKDYPVKTIKKHDLNDCSKAMICGELAQENIIRIDKMSGKLATEYTPYTQIEERKYLEVHNILHYVNTNDPLGDPLDDPNNDPQYSLWEEPVQAWAEEQGYLTEEPPTEYDDIHLPELQPNVSWLSPSNNSTISQGNFTLSAVADAPRGIERLEFFVDDEKVGEVYNSPYTYNYQVDPFLNNGNHTLKVIAFDDLDNFKEASIDINLQLDTSDRDFNLIWLYPNNGDNISLNDLPLNLELNLDRPSQVKKIDFYHILPNEDSDWFEYIENPGNSINVTLEDELEIGIHKLYMVVKDRNDNLITTPAIIFNVE